MGIEEKLPSGILLTSVEKLAGYMRKSSLWPATFGLACCAIEMMATGAGRYDLARFGMEVFRASPRQADLMIVAGRVSQKMAPVLRQIYDQMPNPKWVLAMGVCASSGGMFNNYAIVQGVDHVVPVDMYLPRRAARQIHVDRHDVVDALDDGVVVEHAARRGAHAHREDPLRVGHLVVDLAQHRRHLLADPAGDDHQVGLPRAGPEDLLAPAARVVAGRAVGHHLDGAAGQAEGGRPERCAAHVAEQRLDAGQQHPTGQLLLYP